jgi:hypothetical protein
MTATQEFQQECAVQFAGARMMIHQEMMKRPGRQGEQEGL